MTSTPREIDDSDADIHDPAASSERDLLVLLLDVSGSMAEPSTAPGFKTRAEELEAAVRTFLLDEITTLDHLASSGEIAVGAFQGTPRDGKSVVEWLDLGAGPTHPGSPFQFISEIQHFRLPIPNTGQTPMGHAVTEALDTLDGRLAQFHDLVLGHVPNIMLITDGHASANSPITGPAQRVRALEGTGERHSKPRVVFWAIGTHGARLEELHELATPNGTVFLGDEPLSKIVDVMSASLGTAMRDGVSKLKSDVQAKVSALWSDHSPDTPGEHYFSQRPT